MTYEQRTVLGEDIAVKRGQYGFWIFATEGCGCICLSVFAKEPHPIGEEGGESGDERTRLELEAHLLAAAFQSCYI